MTSLLMPLYVCVIQFASVMINTHTHTQDVTLQSPAVDVQYKGGRGGLMPCLSSRNCFMLFLQSKKQEEPRSLKWKYPLVVDNNQAMVLSLAAHAVLILDLSDIWEGGRRGKTKKLGVQKPLPFTDYIFGLLIPMVHCLLYSWRIATGHY